MKIKAAVLYESGQPYVIEELELRDIKDDEILVKTVASGICMTDEHARYGAYGVPLPAVFGHEGAGIVLETGSRVKSIKPGDHVVTGLSTCGECDNCYDGKSYACNNLGAMIFSGNFYGEKSPLSKDGKTISHFCGQSSFASHMIVKERNAVKISDNIDLKTACTFGCGVMTGSGTVTNCFKPNIGSSIVIMGTGTVGLSALMAAVACGCTDIVAVDKNPLVLEKAKQFGATATILTTETEDLKAELYKICPTGYNYGIDTSGADELINTGTAVLAANGEFAILAQVPTVTANGFMLSGRSQIIEGAGYGLSVAKTYIPRLVKLHERGRLPVDEIISVYPLEQIEQALKDKAEGKIIKPVLVME